MQEAVAQSSLFSSVLLQSMPSERLRNQLTLMSTALHKAITKITPETIKVNNVDAWSELIILRFLGHFLQLR